VNKAKCSNTSNEDDLPWKTTSHGRRPTNIKSGIYQQPFIGSYSNFKLKFRLPKINFHILEMKTTSMEDDLQISKEEYHSNHCMEFRGKLIGYLKCGSAQPSLFYIII
jgi:hypothetical protein